MQGEDYTVARLKLEIANWLNTYGEIQMGPECVEPLSQLIDQTHNEIKKTRKDWKLPDRC